MKKQIINHLAGQFGNPHGPLGRLAGRIMATRGSNIERNRWTVNLLELKPYHRVLEVGYGPGLAIETMLAEVVDGDVVGLDRSATMQAQAAARNADAVTDGRLRLEVGDIDDGLDGLGHFDRIVAVNVWMFWPDPAATIARLVAALEANGRLAITYMPRHVDATADDATKGAEEIAAHFEAAGCTDVQIETLPLDPVPAVCVIGAKP